MTGRRYGSFGGKGTIIAGPYYVDAGEIYRPGAIKGEIYRPGAVAGEVFRPGAIAGEVVE